MPAGLTDQRPARRPWWRRLFAAGAVIAAVVAVSAEARADYDVPAFEGGNELYQKCGANRVYCLGYVGGVSDAISAGEGSTGPISTHALCLPGPGRVSQGQELDVVLQFLTQHPELRQYGAAYLVARALSEAFPCAGR
jgi:hypothetical protein